MKNLIIGILVAATLFLLNPTESDHLKALRIQATEEKGEILGIIDATVKALRKDVVYNNFYFCSALTQKGKLLSVGALKIVIPLAKQK